MGQGSACTPCRKDELGSSAKLEYAGEDMDNAQVGISIGLAVKGLSKISELKKGFDGLKGKIAEAKKAITSLDNTKLSNLSSQIREPKSTFRRTYDKF